MGIIDEEFLSTTPLYRLNKESYEAGEERKEIIGKLTRKKLLYLCSKFTVEQSIKEIITIR